MKNKAKRGDRVQVQCVRLLNDRTATKSPRRRKVLEFTVGSPDVIPGISLGVVGMAKGDLKRLTLRPADAYGPIRSALIRRIPRQRFPTDLELRVGKRLNSVGVTSGRRHRVRIVSIKPDIVIVDGNHPLAGKVLKMEVQLVALHPSSAERCESQNDAEGDE